MKWDEFTRRGMIKAGLTAAATGMLPMGMFGNAWAAAEDDRIVAAAKAAGGADLNGMIWSLYYRNMSNIADDFKAKTGIGVKSIQDISIFQIPQRAMAEALSRSSEFDFFHVDSNMIPSLASAGLLEPLDPYMEKAGYKLDMVGKYSNFMRYRGDTYGIPTDGNVHIQYLRKDLMENPDEKKKFADQHGRELVWPETWEEYQQILEFFNRPDQEIWGSGDLRNRANGVTWWYMYFYSAGGFPFDDEMEPTLNTPAGKYAVDTYLNIKKVSHPEAANWGTPQMIPRIVRGHVAGAQYWDGTIAQIEGPDSTTQGKFAYGLVPGSRLSGEMVHRSVSSPLAALLVNKYSPRKEQAAYMALYWGTLANSTDIVSHREWTFHDPWHRGHFDNNAKVAEAYTPAGVNAIQQNMHVVSPPIYLTGLLEFQDALAKNLSEAYVGQLAADEVLPRTEEAWRGLIGRIGKSRLKDELKSYKAAMPDVNGPPA